MNVFNLSFGKDSMATLILAVKQGIPIDRVMYCDIRFSDEISGEHPLMAAWIPEAERILKERFGITVEHAFSRTYTDFFFAKNQKGNHIGDMHGFPHILSAWCNTILKIQAINKYLSQYGLLSPIYKSEDGIYRGGCWFCPKQCNADLYSLWKNYPDYYQKLVELEPYSPHNKFKPDGNPSDYAKRFEAGYIPVRCKKRDKYVQTSIFDFLEDT